MRFARRLFVLEACAAVLLISLATRSGRAQAADAFEVLGRGAQVYTCSAAAGTFRWQLKFPDATLLNAQGQTIGRHFAGPSWQANDGSLVVGEVVASGNGEPGSIPWLLLRAKSHEGAGILAGVSYVVRSRTAGGAAPGTGCDRDHSGAEVRVEYSAAYTFFSDQDAPKP